MKKRMKKKKINKNKGNFNVFPLFLSQSVDSKLSLNEQDEKDKQDKKGEQEDLITQKFDHYTIITNSQQLLNDITVDASDISKLSINNLSIPYNESTKTLFSHQRHIVLTNNGKKKYKVELMTKNPNFISTSAQTLHEADFIEKERNFEDSLNQNTNLYDGIGDLYYGNDHASENKEKYNSINESDNHNGSKEINNNNIGGVLKKVLNFLSFKSYFYNDNNPSNEKINENKSKEEDANKESNNLNNDNNDENTKENNNENSNKKKMASIGKLVDQYLLNLKNENSTKQELILVFKGELDLNSPHMKNFILEAKNKLESYIKENFKDINEISYEIVTPINFVCFFVPNIFNMNNYDLLKEALSIVYNDLKEYTENWSFSSSYVVDNVDDINEEEHIDKKKREKKYKKKKKRLYNVKYSFLRKILSFNQLLSFSSKNKNKEVDIEKEILSFLPKELRDYSTWNLSIIRVFNAWMLAGYGNKNIKVCIIDSGVDLKHVDLTKNLFVPKYDKRYMMTKEFYDFMVKNPKDSSGHGTHVTGIIGGSINDLGVVGVAPNVTLISLRFIDGKKYGGSLQAIKALNVCILNKAPIINASWGSNVYDSNLHLAVERLKNTFNGKGSVFIAAAGNKAKNNDINPMYPANYKIPHGLSVASISRNLEISVFSNYGVRSVHIMAPGHKIYSTVPNDSYKVSTGTSMATPHVCGVSALIYSVCYNQGFIPQAEDVLDIIIRTAIKIESKERKTIHNSLINAEAAVLTTLLGGLWMQMDCHFVKFFLDQKKKRHIPIVFSAYKKGIYETDIVIAVMSTDKASNAYGEIHIPVKIVTDSKFPSFKESPKFGKNYVVDASEAEHDEILSYICENAIFNMHEYNYTLYFILLIVLLILAFILLFVASIYFRKKIHKQKEGEKNNFLNDQKILNNHMDTRQEKNEENTLGYKKNSFNIINRKKEENNQNENIYFFQEIKQPLLERRETKIDNGNCVNENGNLDMFVDGE